MSTQVWKLAPYFRPQSSLTCSGLKTKQGSMIASEIYNICCECQWLDLIMSRENFTKSSAKHWPTVSKFDPAVEECTMSPWNYKIPLSVKSKWQIVHKLDKYWNYNNFVVNITTSPAFLSNFYCTCTKTAISVVPEKFWRHHGFSDVNIIRTRKIRDC